MFIFLIQIPSRLTALSFVGALEILFNRYYTLGTAPSIGGISFNKPINTEVNLLYFWRKQSANAMLMKFYLTELTVGILGGWATLKKTVKLTRLLLVMAVLISTVFLDCSNQTVDNNHTIFTNNEKDSTSPTNTNAQKFFKCIYLKYPNNYYPLGSTLFSESHDQKTNKLIWKFSFCVVDSTKTDESKYLKEINDTVLKQFLPSTYIYFGTHTHHYEIGGHANFIGFLHKDSGDFVVHPIESDLNYGFINILKGISIADKNEQEKFSSSLLTNLVPALFLRFQEYKKVETTYSWTDNILSVTNKYKSDKKYDASVTLVVSFTNDRISNLLLK